jgi:hypothetical protein
MCSRHSVAINIGQTNRIAREFFNRIDPFRTFARRQCGRSAATAPCGFSLFVGVPLMLVAALAAISLALVLRWNAAVPNQ